MMNPDSPDTTLVLLDRLHHGDEHALGELLTRDLDWIRAYVHKRLVGVVRSHADTGDVVGEVVLRVLKHGPRFRLGDRGQFRALLARVVTNHLRSAAGRAGRAPRALGGGETVLDLGGCGTARRATPPPERAQRREEEEWTRLALSLLPGPAHDVIRLRDFEKIPFAQIGEQLGISEDAARMRYNRSLRDLTRNVVRLKNGRLAEILADDEDAACRASGSEADC